VKADEEVASLSAAPALLAPCKRDECHYEEGGKLERPACRLELRTITSVIGLAALI